VCLNWILNRITIIIMNNSNIIMFSSLRYFMTSNVRNIKLHLRTAIRQNNENNLNIEQFIPASRTWHWTNYTSRVAFHTEALHKEKMNAFRAWQTEAVCAGQLRVEKTLLRFRQHRVSQQQPEKIYTYNKDGYLQIFLLSASPATYEGPRTAQFENLLIF